MRVKIIQAYRQYGVGQTLNLPKDVAKLLIKEGVAIKTKDMNETDMRIR